MNEGNKQNYTIKMIEKNEQNVNSILEIEYSAFGDNALNNWSLTPYLRYGCAFGLFVFDSMKGFVIFIKTWDNPKFAYLIEFAIERDDQGKGNGSYLLLQSLLHLKKKGLCSVGLTVDLNNSTARHIYCDKFGFKIIELRQDEYGKGLKRFFLKLDLENWNP
jgi:ribosomal-protein-alanine N-acetyltransferase